VTIAAVLSSIVLVAVIEVVRELLKKWRSKPERESETFVQMRSVVDSYVHLVEVHEKAARSAEDAAKRLRAEVDATTAEVVELRSKVAVLETALEDAHVMITRMMELAKIGG